MLILSAALVTIIVTLVIVAMSNDDMEARRTGQCKDDIPCQECGACYGDHPTAFSRHSYVMGQDDLR